MYRWKQARGGVSVEKASPASMRLSRAFTRLAEIWVIVGGIILQRVDVPSGVRSRGMSGQEDRNG